MDTPTRIAIPGRALTLSISPTAVSALNRAIRDFHAHSEIRGAEIGGILNVVRGRDVLELDSFQVIPASAQQASWEMDPAAAESLLERPAGIFRTNTRKGWSLSRPDLALCDRFQPLLFLLIRPFETRPHECAVFLEDRFDPETEPNVEFTMEAEPVRTLTRRAPALPTGVPAAVPRSPVDPHAGSKWLTLALCSALLGGAGGYALHRLLPAGFSMHPEPGLTREGSRLQFTASAADHLITLKWNTAAAVVERASGGSLWISDGGNIVERELSLTQIRTGLFVYPALEDHLILRLSIRSDREQVTETVSVNVASPPA